MMKAEMNRHLLLCFGVIVLLATVGCRPRHLPHTPQPFSAEDVITSLSSSVISPLFKTVFYLPRNQHEG